MKRRTTKTYDRTQCNECVLFRMMNENDAREHVRDYINATQYANECERAYIDARATYQRALRTRNENKCAQIMLNARFELMRAHASRDDARYAIVIA